MELTARRTTPNNCFSIHLLRLCSSAALLLNMTMIAAGQANLTVYQRLTEVTSATSLVYVERPWHLKMQVTLYGKGGKAPEDGTIERWQAGDDSRTISTFGNASRTDLEHNGQIYRAVTGDPIPDGAEAALQAVLPPGPFPSPLAGTEPDLRKKSFGKVQLDCIMLTRPMSRSTFAPLGLFPTYCLTAEDHLDASYNFGSWTVLRTQIGKFLDHEVTIGMSIMEGAQMTARGKVTELSTFTPKPDEFEPSPELAATAIAARVAGSVMQGRKISGSPPMYPVSARQGRISGTVILSALIGTDGRIHYVDAISGPDPDLVISAIAAVKDWRYKPYLLNEVPVDVNTTVTVNYSFK